MIKKRIFLIILSLVFSAFLSSQLRIEIKGGLEDPINIAIVPFQWNLKTPQQESIQKVVQSDLESFGEYAVLSPENMLSLPSRAEEVFLRIGEF